MAMGDIAWVASLGPRTPPPLEPAAELAGTPHGTRARASASLRKFLTRDDPAATEKCVRSTSASFELKF